MSETADSAAQSPTVDRRAPISVIIPTYQREEVLIDTLRSLAPMLEEGDEIIVVDQTARHHPSADAALHELSAAGKIRWIRKTRPNQAEAMNAGAGLARGVILLFLDDDIVPSRTLLQAHRGVLAQDDPPPATCGQVLQPWNEAPVDRVDEFGVGFNAAYRHPCEILSLMAGNFAIRRETYFVVGGIDENFRGANYRIDAELAYRIFFRTGRKVRFVPEASVRHLLSGGGNRAFGAKDAWGSIGGSVGDYYFAMRCLPPRSAVAHVVRRLVRAPLSRYTVRRPWLIPTLALRELVAWCIAARRLLRRWDPYAKPVSHYTDVLHDPPGTAAEPRGLRQAPTT